MTVPFLHLKLHSEYSISDGLLRIPALIDSVKALGMPAVAITDRCNLFAMVKFYRKAIQAGVKPIVGAEIALKDGDEIFYVTLLCQNQYGYKNLTQLISQSYLQGQERAGQPLVQRDWLVQYQQGLLVLSGAQVGDVGQAIIAGKDSLAEQRLQWWLTHFKDRFYLEVQRTEREFDDIVLHGSVALAEQYQVPVVATNDVRFLHEEDFEAHEARVCIHASYVLDDPRRPRLYHKSQYLKSAEQMAELFSDLPEALENTLRIAERCTLELELDKPQLPQFPVPNGESAETYFAQQASDGLKARLQQSAIVDKAQIALYQQRLQRELEVINGMGFPGYYLIVADFIAWAKQQNIPVGPGRGSGAGSLIAYVLGITELDPIEHELLFERFLNPERVSMPDFDIDFCMEQRDRVIDYVADRYGRDAVSQIITYGTMAAKAVVRDVGRVLGLPYGFCDKIAKLIPFELGITLDKALEQQPELRERYENEEEVASLIDLARKLEGVTRNAGKHAGGVVIAPTKLVDFAPLYCEQGGVNLVTQFDKDDAEAVGLVKFDFLGLRTLTIIQWALQTINAKREKLGKSLLDIQHISLSDAKTFALLQQCSTTAVFQLESRGMKELVRRLIPECFEEITALVALFRPGPLQSGMVDDFIDRKHGRQEVQYPHPDLEPILRNTYGVILYQEQVMQIAQVLAGYSLGGADILRRAMGKKKPEEMAKQREVFTAGCSARGINETLAQTIFDLMEKFAGYGFNKSHSAAYALIAYQTAWLKAHYPAEFMAAVLSSDMDNTDKVVLFLEECANLQLTVRKPCINESFYKFTVNESGEIVYGLGAIKGVGEQVVEQLVRERERNGLFSDLFSFCQRIEGNKLGRRSLEPLVLAGSMDCFQQSRAVLMASIEKALKSSEQKQRDAQVGQVDLFAGDDQEQSIAIDYVDATQWPLQQQLQGEKNALGWYLSGHPVDYFKEEIVRLKAVSFSELSQHIRREVSYVGMLISVRTLVTKSGRRMAIATMEDRSGKVDVTLFSKLYDLVQRQLEKEQTYLVKAKVEEDDYSGGVRLVAEDIKPIQQVRENLIKGLRIDLSCCHSVETMLVDLQKLITAHRGGQCPVILRYHANQAAADIALGERWRVSPEEELLAKLRQMIGADAVAVEY